MAWHPNDLVTDVDLTAYENAVLTQFGVAGWETKRTKALDDWLGPILRTQGFQIERLRTRNEADLAYRYTAAAYSDVTSAVRDTTPDDLNLATTFATVGTDALYIGSKQQFRGLSVRMHEGVSAVAAVTTVAYWGDSWTALAIADGTAKTSGKAFSGGGSITWAVPSMWVKRSINGSDPLYWDAKADYYEKEADAALQRALLIIGGEFESDDPPTDQISEEEAEQTVAEVNGGGWRMERA
jgi:hypothetical protein